MASWDFDSHAAEEGTHTQLLELPKHDQTSDCAGDALSQGKQFCLDPQDAQRRGPSSLSTAADFLSSFPLSWSMEVLSRWFQDFLLSEVVGWTALPLAVPNGYPRVSAVYVAHERHLPGIPVRC